MKGLWGWYYRRSIRQRAWIRWGFPLLVVALIVQGDWVFRHYEGVASAGQARSVFLRAGFLMFSAMSMKTFLTRDWTMQDLGLVLTGYGFSGLLIRLLARWGPQPVSEFERDYIHALLDIGIILLFVGILFTTIARIRRHWRQRHYGQPRFDRRKGERRKVPQLVVGPPSDL